MSETVTKDVLAERVFDVSATMVTLIIWVVIMGVAFLIIAIIWAVDEPQVFTSSIPVPRNCGTLCSDADKVIWYLKIVVVSSDLQYMDITRDVTDFEAVRLCKVSGQDRVEIFKYSDSNQEGKFDFGTTSLAPSGFNQSESLGFAASSLCVLVGSVVTLRISVWEAALFDGRINRVIANNDVVVHQAQESLPQDYQQSADPSKAWLATELFNPSPNGTSTSA